MLYQLSYARKAPILAISGNAPSTRDHAGLPFTRVSPWLPPTRATHR
jgi:hypothetical protein